MNAAIFIYLADVLSSIGMVCAVTGAVGILVFLFVTSAYYEVENEYHGRNWAWIVPCTMLVVACFIPSSKTMYMMAGAVLGEKVIDSKVGHQLQELLELKLDKELEKLKKETTK